MKAVCLSCLVYDFNILFFFVMCYTYLTSNILNIYPPYLLPFQMTRVKCEISAAEECNIADHSSTGRNPRTYRKGKVEITTHLFSNAMIAINAGYRR
jgi:hypothetical protein